MPRLELNNPTRRILRLLDEIDALEAWAAEVDEITLAAGIFERIPPRPTLQAVIEERTRQHVMGRRTEAQRITMRLRRARNTESCASGLTQAQELLREVEREEIATTLGLGGPAAPQGLHPCPRCSAPTASLYCFTCTHAIEAENAPDPFKL